MASNDYRTYLPLGGSSRRYEDITTGSIISRYQYEKLRQTAQVAPKTNRQYEDAVRSYAAKHNQTTAETRRDKQFQKDYALVMKDRRGGKRSKVSHKAHDALYDALVDIGYKDDDGYDVGDTPTAE